MSLKESHYLLNYQINSVVYVDYDEISLLPQSYSLCFRSCNSCCAFADNLVTMFAPCLVLPPSHLSTSFTYVACFVCCVLFPHPVINSPPPSLSLHVCSKEQKAKTWLLLGGMVENWLLKGVLLKDSVSTVS